LLNPRVSSYRGRWIYPYAVARTLRARRVTIHTDRSLRIFADGEPLTECSTTEVQIRPLALRVAA
jgi:diacylglycerol kinase family enzyme